MRHRAVISYLVVGFVLVGGASLRADDAADLAKQLKDPSPEVRATAAFKLGNLGDEGRAFTKELFAALPDEDANVRRAVVGAIGQLKPAPEQAVPLFAQALSDADPAVAMAAVNSLADEGKAVVPAMIKALDNDEACYWACLVLAEIGPDAKDAVPALVKSLDHPHNEVRREVIMAIGAIGPDAKDATPALTKALADKDTAVSLAAIYALGNIGPGAKDASPEVKKFLSTGDAFVKTISVWALAKMHPEDKELMKKAIPLLVAGLQSDDRGVRLAAARALIDLKPDHEILLPEISKVMEEAGPEAVADMLEAVAAVGKPAVPGLVRMLKYPKIRPLVARVVAQIGPDAAGTAPAIADVFADCDADTKRELLFALGAIGPEAKVALPQIAKALSSQDEKVRYSAVYALGKIGPAAKDEVPALRQNLGSDDKFYRTVSAWALVEIDPNGDYIVRDAVPILVAALEHERGFVQSGAGSALAKLGPKAKEAIPVLRKLKDDETEEGSVRAAAEEALKKIEG